MRKHSWLKKSIASLLVLTMLLGVMPLTVFASDAKTLEEINRENAAAYAVSFVDVVYENPGLDAGDVIPFYDENDTLSGYCVDILNDGKPNGYVIIKFLNGEQSVSEFAIEPGIKNPYDQMVEEENLSQENVAYYSVGPTDYQIVDANSNAVYSFENENTTVSQFQTMKQEVQLQKTLNAEEVGLDSGTQTYSTNGSYTDYIINYYDGVRVSSGELSGAGAVNYCTQRLIESMGKKYACTVVAICNLLRYYYSRGYNKIDGDLSKMYDAVWNYAGTGSDGNTNFASAASGIRNYLNSRGYACNCDLYMAISYHDFVREINNGKPCTLTYNLSLNNGHTVFVNGYIETTQSQYLQVIDGWYSTHVRYFNCNMGGVYLTGIAVQIVI